MQNNILIVDDHPLVAQGVKALLEPTESVTEIATSGIQALELINKCDFDLYILDISIPDLSGFELIDVIRRKDSSALILIHTMHEEVWYVNKMIALGVQGIVLKSSAMGELANAVECVLQGDVYTCPRFQEVHAKLTKEHEKAFGRQKPSTRELQVLQLIADGLNTNEIAQSLGLSVNTVETFRKRLIRKFTAKNAIDLVVKAFDKGYLNRAN